MDPNAYLLQVVLRRKTQCGLLPGRRAVAAHCQVCLRLTGRIYWIVRSLLDCR